MPHCPKTVRVKRSRCYVTAHGQDLNFATLGAGETTAGDASVRHAQPARQDCLCAEPRRPGSGLLEVLTGKAHRPQPGVLAWRWGVRGTDEFGGDLRNAAKPGRYAFDLRRAGRFAQRSISG
jgi:hypothetical protein